MDQSDDKPARRIKRHVPATTPEGREAQLVSFAFDLAAKRIQEGSASAQEIVHFLKLGSSRERLDQQKIKLENDLLRAKQVQIESQAVAESMYRDALNAMRRYSGQDPAEVQDAEPDYYD